MEQPIITGEFVNPYLVRSQQRRYLCPGRLTSVDDQVVICDNGQITLVSTDDEIIVTALKQQQLAQYFPAIDAWATHLSREQVEKLCKRNCISFKSGHVRPDRTVEITRSFDGRFMAAKKKQN